MHSDHPGLHRTLHLFWQRFWWPSRVRDTWDFIAPCALCTRGKSRHRPPAGLLTPLPIPRCPWSHIALDFITGLSLLSGHTTILTVVDRFLKAAHLVALPKPPSTAATGDLLVQHVFRIHNLPKDIVSDKGPQFNSRFGARSAQ